MQTTPSIHAAGARARSRAHKTGLRLAVGLATGLVGLVAFAPAPSARAEELPDGRAYELVTPTEKNGLEPGVMGIAPNGEEIDWEATGGCCGASSGAVELYRAQRGAEGWSTTPLTPAPKRPLVGIFEEQAPMFTTSDLSETIFETPSSYSAGDVEDGALNLYLVGPEGTPAWLSQGPLGGSPPESVTFDGANADAGTVVFSTAAPLTADATGLGGGGAAQPDYLYARQPATNQTSLVDVDNNDQLIDPLGATLGNGGFLNDGDIPADYNGTTTNAISSDGTKVFFESPPYGLEGLGATPLSHLYMRDLATHTTTALDEPSSSGYARYEGAAEDGSLVFFTSNEGLGGDPYTDTELYEANTTEHQIGPAAPGSVYPISAGGGPGFLDGELLGATAIANDGSHVYFVAKGVLAGNTDAEGGTATQGEPNLYVFDTATGQTTFVVTLGQRDVETEDEPGPLVAEPDLDRPAIPTPDGTVLIFDSSANLTGQNEAGPATTLTAEAEYGRETPITVASTAGMIAGRTVQIGSGPFAETRRITAVVDATHLKLSSPFNYSHQAGESVELLSAFELYRYATANGSLVCVSCSPPGVVTRGSVGLGGGAGGTYGDSGYPVPMSADGSRIFFTTTSSLLPGDVNGEEQPVGPFRASLALDVYEWEGGQLHLISAGRTTGAALAGTTPSGNDVFFLTAARLAGKSDGFYNLYDARVGGGFGTPPAPPSCEGTGCRPTAPSQPETSSPPASTLVPEQATLIAPPTPAPTFAVGAVSATQSARFAKSGRLALTVSASVAGAITARVYATLRGHKRQVASGAVTVPAGGSRQLLLALTKAARTALASHGELSLRIEVSFTRAGPPKTVRLTLTATPRSRRARTKAHAGNHSSKSEARR
jgi:hypothetical protein